MWWSAAHTFPCLASAAAASMHGRLCTASAHPSLPCICCCSQYREQGVIMYRGFSVQDMAHQVRCARCACCDHVACLQYACL